MGGATAVGGAAGWVEVASGEAPLAGELRTVKKGGCQLVVGRGADGRLFALDNRCPHEGYPLAQGSLKGDELTCRWHNWKFRVGDGACLLGGEAVRAYPVREREGRVEVDLREPDPAVAVPRLRASLLEGAARHETDRAVRDAARLLAAGYTAERLAADLAVHDALHGEYGSTHALPVAADCLRLAAGRAGAEKLYALVHAIDLLGDEVAWRPAQPAAPVLSGGDEAGFRAAVEDEDGARAEGLARGALAAGRAPAEVWRWLLGSASDHFTDFGHPLIYVVKAVELLPHAGAEGAAGLLAGLTRSLVLATREDTLPYLAPYRARLDEVDAELAGWHAAARAQAPFDPPALRDAVLDGTAREALDALVAALAAGVAAPRVARALVLAAAHRLLRFDERHDLDAEVAENWLWASHRLTFASAVRVACERWPSPDSLRLLFQALAFIHSGRPMDAPPGYSTSLAAGEDGTVKSIAEAVRARDPALAVGRASAFLAAGGDPAPLHRALEELCLATPLVRPIFVAHAIKTTLAGIDEHRALAGHPDRDAPLLAAVRFLAAPVAEQRLAALVRRNLRWVVDGEVPRKLTQ